ncbi:MAG: DMT family transporter, partial [Thermocladium sp.]
TNAYLLIYILSASSNYFFVKNGLSYSDPLTFMALRYALASASLAIPLAALHRLNPIIDTDMLLLSAFTAAGTGFWAIGLTYVDPGTSAVLSYTMPLFAVPFSMIMLHESPSRGNVIGVIVGFLGVMVYYISFLGSIELIGAVFTVINAVFWALYSVYFRKLGNREPMNVVAMQMLISSLMLIAVAIPMGIRIRLQPMFLLDLAGTSLVGGSALFLFWNLIINNMGVSRAVSVVFLVPALTIVLNYLVLGRTPTTLELIGATIMFVGIYISQRRGLNIKGPTSSP